MSAKMDWLGHQERIMKTYGGLMDANARSLNEAKLQERLTDALDEMRETLKDELRQFVRDEIARANEENAKVLADEMGKALKKVRLF